VLYISGLQLTVDGYVRDVESLAKSNILQLFDVLVAKLGMTYLMHPVAYDVPTDPAKIPTDEDEGGTSYTCQITTSHINLHNWPLRRAVMMDIMSCKTFDLQVAAQLIHQYLDFEVCNFRWQERTDPRVRGGWVAHGFLDIEQLRIVA